MKKFVLLCTLASFLLGGVAMAEEAGQKTKSNQLEEHRKRHPRPTGRTRKAIPTSGLCAAADPGERSGHGTAGSGASSGRYHAMTTFSAIDVTPMGTRERGPCLIGGDNAGGKVGDGRPLIATQKAILRLTTPKT